ncbi:hypothetical protein CF328_g291 [Tilletia controversa]|nr:hypothetical protein CF328_g291 [Tilletia controversa]
MIKHIVPSWVDLNRSDSHAQVFVKVMSEVDVDLVTSDVVKAKVNHILISGHVGSTSTACWSSFAYAAGLPLELGLLETHPTLLQDDLQCPRTAADSQMFEDRLGYGYETLQLGHLFSWYRHSGARACHQLTFLF